MLWPFPGVDRHDTERTNFGQPPSGDGGDCGDGGGGVGGVPGARAGNQGRPQGSGGKLSQIAGCRGGLAHDRAGSVRQFHRRRRIILSGIGGCARQGRGDRDVHRFQRHA